MLVVTIGGFHYMSNPDLVTDPSLANPVYLLIAMIGSVLSYVLCGYQLGKLFSKPKADPVDPLAQQYDEYLVKAERNPPAPPRDY